MMFTSTARFFLGPIESHETQRKKTKTLECKPQGPEDTETWVLSLCVCSLFFGFVCPQTKLLAEMRWQMVQVRQLDKNKIEDNEVHAVVIMKRWCHYY